MKGFSNKQNLKIVAFNHFFDQDLMSMHYAIKKGINAELGVISPFILYELVKIFIPTIKHEYRGYIDKRLILAKETLRKVLLRLLRELQKEIPGVVFLAPSDQFYWIREFVMACREVGFPFFILDKEGTISPHDFRALPLDIKTYMPLIADYFLVWSERQAQFHLNAGGDKDKIYIVGQPRSDFWFHNDLWAEKEKFFKELGINSNNKTVLFFDFMNNNYIRDEYFKKGFNWDDFLLDIHSVLFVLAEKHKDINFIFKTHPQAQNTNEIRTKIKKSGLKNVFLVTGAKASTNLIINSDLVIGFVTTALLDAMLTDKPIIYTFWGNAPDFKDNIIRFDENKGIDIARRKDEFERIVEKYIANDFSFTINNKVREARRKLTDIFFYNADGNVGERVLHMIRELKQKYYEK